MMERRNENAGPNLGFGMMRLPRTTEGTYDEQQILRMVDRYLAAGYAYFDTAYTYDGGDSERMVRKAITDRYPRERFILATKLPSSHVKQAGDARRLLETSLERTGAGFFDYYLIHNVHKKNLERIEGFRLWDFLQEIKSEGLARHVGFSFHDTADVLDRILTENPALEFVQLQINYADWENPSIQSRACYETARRHGKKVLVMEPVKGGSLADGNVEMKAIFSRADPAASPASWALRFAASLDGLIAVLSGMSNLDQLEDNLRTFRSFRPLTESDRNVIKQILAVYNRIERVPCTACAYCVRACPGRIPIPSLIGVYNDTLIYAKNPSHQRLYGLLTATKGPASACIKCGACAALCPQHLDIPEIMERIAAVFDSN